MDKLEDLSPRPVVVKVAGEEIGITPIRVKELAAFAAAVKPILLGAGGVGENMDVPALLLAHPQSIVDTVTVGARKPRDFVDALEIDELVILAMAVVEVNADFFARRVAPAVTAGVTRVAARLTGLNSTPDSGAQDSEA